MELHLAAPRSIVLNNKQEIESIRRRIRGNKLKLDRGSRLKCKADFSAEDLMNKNKGSNSVHIYVCTYIFRDEQKMTYGVFL